MKGLMMHYPLTTNAIIEYGNRVFPKKSIVSYLPDGSRHHYTFADLYHRSKKLAHALVHQLGVQEGDMVGTFAWNHYQHTELYYGIPGAGAVCHTINVRLAPQQIAYIINHSEDKIIFADATLVALLEKIAPLLASAQHYIIFNTPPNFTTTLPNVLYYEDILNNAADNFEWVQADEDEACGMCYTSGTTGLPKGVVYSHRSTFLHALAAMSANAAGVTMNDKLLIIVPQFHVMAWGAPYFCFLSGTEIVMPSSNLQPAALVNMIEKEKVSKSMGIPTILLGIYEVLKKNPITDFPLQAVTTGGAAAPPKLIAGFENELGIKVIQGWGMTETSPIATISRLQNQHQQLPEEEQVKIIAKQGIELPGVELRAVTEDGTVAQRDGVTVGEIQIRGAWIINSYFKTTSSDSFTEDGWFKTGDVGTIGEDSYMQITDRAKDLIKSGGEWISSVALEVALMAHPQIKEAAVIAIPDEKWGERPLGVVTLRNEEAKPDCSELQQFLSKDFAKYQIPTSYIFVSEIPKTSVGKFDKKEMRKRYAEGTLV